MRRHASAKGLDRQVFGASLAVFVRRLPQDTLVAAGDAVAVFFVETLDRPLSVDDYRGCLFFVFFDRVEIVLRRYRANRQGPVFIGVQNLDAELRWRPWGLTSRVPELHHQIKRVGFRKAKVLASGRDAKGVMVPTFTLDRGRHGAEVCGTPGDGLRTINKGRWGRLGDSGGSIAQPLD